MSELCGPKGIGNGMIFFFSLESMSVFLYFLLSKMSLGLQLF